MLQRIINNGIIGRSEFIEATLIKKIGLYVTCKSFFEAFKILEKEKFIMITGNPGVGKTSLAFIIIYRYLAEGYHLIFMDEKISEGEAAFNPDQNVKQIFFLDDFLGRNYLEIMNPRNKESSIVNFTERIRHTPNKFLILTTRTTILNQASYYQEKLFRANLSIARFEIRLSEYNELEKAKILYNHLFFNELPYEYISKVFENKNYWQIIKHRNYNPRLIEFITSSSNYLKVKPADYFNFIISTLNNPNEIWRFAFENQLNDEERFLLITLLSFGRSSDFDNIEKAYEARIEYESKNNNYQRKINSFEISLKILLDGYIKNVIQTGWQSGNWIEFINPSLGDFLINYLSESTAEKWRVLESCIFFEQYQSAFTTISLKRNTIEIKGKEIPRLLKVINSKQLISTDQKLTEQHLFLKYACLNLLFKEPQISEKNTIEWLSRINWEILDNRLYDDLHFIFTNTENCPKLIQYIKSNWDLLISKLFLNARSEDELGYIKGIFDLYNRNYEEFTNEDEHYQIISQSIDTIFESIENDIISDNKSSITKAEMIDDVQHEINRKYEELYEEYLNAYVSYGGESFRGIDVDALIEQNLERIGYDESRQDEWKDMQHVKDTTQYEVDNLFSF